MSVIFVERDRVHYEVLGHGRAVIFLHGWVGSWRYWIPAMQATSPQFRTYAIDLWGFGDSAKVSEHYSINHQVALLNFFLRTMGIERVALVGHGLGAVVALLFASWFPEQVDRLLAVGLPVDKCILNSRIEIEEPQVLAEWLLAHNQMAEAAQIETLKTDRHALLTSVANLRTIDIDGMIARYNHPCLLVHSQDDPLVTPPGRDWVANLPYMVHDLIFEQSGHYPMLKENAVFNRLLADFLALFPGQTPRDLQLKEEWKRRVR